MKFIIINPNEIAAYELIIMLKKVLDEMGEAPPQFKIVHRGEEVDQYMELEEEKCIVTDLCLPDEPPLQTVKRIREMDPHIPIVIYSEINGYPMECYHANVTYYLLRPVSKEMVRKMLRRLFDWTKSDIIEKK